MSGQDVDSRALGQWLDAEIEREKERVLDDDLDDAFRGGMVDAYTLVKREWCAARDGYTNEDRW